MKTGLLLIVSIFFTSAAFAGDCQKILFHNASQDDRYRYRLSFDTTALGGSGPVIHLTADARDTLPLAGDKNLQGGNLVLRVKKEEKVYLNCLYAMDQIMGSSDTVTGIRTFPTTGHHLCPILHVAENGCKVTVDAIVKA